MSNKMLIDTSHPEETRVAVVRGNRVEEFDFESAEKKQLRGNIYLAKVTRVEPSLQAAFVDYGGNRHGFLAFSEIHPDYYQIPFADRQALLEAEAEEARASQKAEDDEFGDDDGEESEPVKPKRKPRRRKNASPASEESKEADVVATTETADTEAVSLEQAEEKAEDEPDAEPEVAAKPKRKTTRRRAPKKPKNAEETVENAEASNDEGATEEPDGSSTIAAIIEMDTISEPLPDDEEPEDSSGETAEADVEEEPKRRRTSRPRRKKKVETTEAAEEALATVETASTTDVAANDESSPASSETQASSEAEEPVSEDGDKAEAAAEAPKTKRRRSSRRKPKASSDKREGDENAPENNTTDPVEDNGLDAGDDADDDVESVGQEDALEEVATPRRMRKQYKIQEVIKRRQILLVQVVKEERGNKGAALTTYLSLAGRYSVLMPNTARGGGISRKITNAADRKRLKTIANDLNVPEGMGVILRTAGATRTKPEITRDFQYLMRLWEQVRNLTLSSSAPCLVYEEGSLIKRSIRDLYNKDTDEILVAGNNGYEEARDFMGMLMPSHVKKVKHYQDAQAIFTRYGVESHLDNMVTPQVTLKSGGYLVINQTEALVAVDVNSGRATREHSVEKTALQTNLEAAEEVARQLRLRDLAGLIVIDFIDMEERRNNRAVEKKLKDCLKNDRARIQVGRISHFGLMEMSRQRMRASVLESTMQICPHCAGTGYIRSDTAIVLHVLRGLEEHVSKNRRHDVVLRTTPSVAMYLLNQKRAAIVEIEQQSGIMVEVRIDPDLQGQQFEFDKGEQSKREIVSSAVGYDGDSLDTATEEKPKKRSRRRRRDEDEEKTSQQTDEEQEAEEQASPATDQSSEDETDDRPRKKRRRGKRGGRKRRGDEGTADTEAAASEHNSSDGQVEASSPAEAAVDTDTDTPVNVETSSTTETSNVEEPERKPARSTRRKKAPISASKAEVISSETETHSVAEDISTSAEEPPRPKRRNTRRKPADEPQSEEATEAQSEAVLDTQDATQEPEQATEGDGEKKAGWWNRGFF
ncbi:MAG: Rne/Rng family ribonuclease [Pseudomonadota bacterium]